ncbi:ankyrin [Daldinia bambusicola]|nr:ankyrin [Daldinia bambusicola]
MISSFPLLLSEISFSFIYLNCLNQRSMIQSARMGQNIVSTLSTNRRAWILDMPEELIVYILSFLPEPRDRVALSRAGNRNLYRIAIYELLKTSGQKRLSALSWACINGDVNLLHILFRLGMDVNHIYGITMRCSRCGDKFPKTPLSLAVCYQQINIVEVLLNKYHANASYQAVEMPSLLECALGPDISQENKVYLMDLLLLHGSKHEHSRYDRIYLICSPIIRVFYDDYIPPRVLAKLIGPSSDLNYPFVSFHPDESKYCVTQMYYPPIRRFTSVQVEKLKIMRDATLSARKSHLTTPEAIRFRSLSDLLKLRGICNSDLSITKHKQMLEIELQDYPSINDLEPMHGSTVWSLAVNQVYKYVPYRLSEESRNEELEGMLSMLQMVLDAGADPRQSYEAQKKHTHNTYSGFCGSGYYNWKTPLSCLCATLCHYIPDIGKVVDFLVQAGEYIDAQDMGGLTPLHFASKFIHPDLVEKFISCGANVNMVNKEGLSALHFVSRRDFPIHPVGDPCSIQRRSRTVQTLLAHGADPSTVDGNGFTPLHYACMNGFLEVVSLLIADPRVDVNAETHELGTALHYLPYQRKFHQPARNTPRYMGKVEIAKILISAGADVRARDGNNWMPIVHARRYGFFKLTKMLLDNGGDDGFGLGGVF